MKRRYELTDQEWEQIADLFPKEATGKPGRPPKGNRKMLNAMVWIARSGAAWRGRHEDPCNGGFLWISSLPDPQRRAA